QQPCIPALPSTAPPLTHSPFLTIFSSEPQRPERLLTGDTMFIAFFYYLRARGLKVSTTEWLTLMQALAQGMEHQSLMGFYQVCRCLVVKREADFDLYDQAFSEFFKDVSISEEALAKLLQDVDDWLADAKPLPELTDEQLAAL